MRHPRASHYKLCYRRINKRFARSGTTFVAKLFWIVRNRRHIDLLVQSRLSKARAADSTIIAAIQRLAISRYSCFVSTSLLTSNPCATRRAISASYFSFSTFFVRDNIHKNSRLASLTATNW